MGGSNGRLDRERVSTIQGLFPRMGQTIYWCMAQHIAHRMEPEKFKDNKVGKLMLNIGVPLCRTIGKLMRRNKGMENA